jgi:hypothetical protein
MVLLHRAGEAKSVDGIDRFRPSRQTHSAVVRLMLFASISTMYTVDLAIRMDMASANVRPSNTTEKSWSETDA